MPALVASIVIVSWNTRALLLTCLNSLDSSWPDGTLQVVVVDNASIDGSPAMVNAEHPEALLIQTGANVGYAKAVNRGFKQCTADFVCLLNSDTEMTPSALATMVDYLRLHPEVGLVGPALLNPDGSHQSSRRKFPFFWPSLARMAQRRSELNAPTGPKKAEWLVGACLVLSRHLLQRLGGMDETFPFYGEDMELAYRVRLEGLEVVQLPAARVRHVGEGSSRSGASPTMRVRSYYEAPLRFLCKHGSSTEVLLWRLGRGTVAAARYATVRWLRRGVDAERQLALWAGVVRLCVRGAPSEWSLGSSL